MRKILLALMMILFISTIVAAADFVHPLDFKGTQAEKDKIIAYIKENVKSTYSKIGMGDPSTLRMMEKEELDNFKRLTKVKNRKLLDNVIKQYCNIGMCNYNTIYMIYQEQLKASEESLNW